MSRESWNKTVAHLPIVTDDTLCEPGSDCFVDDTFSSVDGEVVSSGVGGSVDASGCALDDAFCCIDGEVVSGIAGCSVDASRCAMDDAFCCIDGEVVSGVAGCCVDASGCAMDDASCCIDRDVAAGDGGAFSGKSPRGDGGGGTLIVEGVSFDDFVRASVVDLKTLKHKRSQNAMTKCFDYCENGMEILSSSEHNNQS